LRFFVYLAELVICNRAGSRLCLVKAAYAVANA
jgi:hypothetical protein